MLPLIRCEQPTGKVMTAGHILNIPHGSKPADVPPEPSLPSSGKTSKASKKSRKLPGAPVVQMITPQTSPSATVTPALHPNAAFTSDPTFTVDPTPLVAIPEASLASHPFNSDPNHAVNNIENLIGVPCNDCLDKAAEQQAIARSKSKRRARRNKKYDDDYYLNAEGGMDDTMRDPNGEPICEIPEKARWQEGNKPLVVPTIAGVEKASWTKKRRRLSGG